MKDKKKLGMLLSSLNAVLGNSLMLIQLLAFYYSRNFTKKEGYII